jgi:hypothetical protein
MRGAGRSRAQDRYDASEPPLHLHWPQQISGLRSIAAPVHQDIHMRCAQECGKRAGGVGGFTRSPGVVMASRKRLFAHEAFEQLR